MRKALLTTALMSAAAVSACATTKTSLVSPSASDQAGSASVMADRSIIDQSQSSGVSDFGGLPPLQANPVPVPITVAPSAGR